MSAVQPSGDERQRLVDQHVWAIVRASGGWNARTRARLAHFASTKNVESWRITAALRRMTGGGKGATQVTDAAAARVQATSASSASSAGATGSGVTGAGASASPVAATTPSNDAKRGMIIAGSVFAGALVVSGALIWVAVLQVERARTAVPPAVTFAPSDPTAHIKTNGASATHASPGVGSAPLSTSRLGTPTRTVPAAPAIFVKPPVLVGDLTTAWLREALETLSADEAQLERAAAGSNPLTEAESAALLRTLDAWGECWPVLEPPRRASALTSLLRAVTRIDAASRDSLMNALAAQQRSMENTPRAWWKSASAAGLRQALEGTGAGAPTDEFALGAIAWLRQRAGAVVDSAATAAPGPAADLCEAWLTALDAAAATSGQEAALSARDAAVTSALEALLRSGAPLDRSGTPADAAGSLLDSIPWAGSAPRRMHMVQVLKAWFEDASVQSGALHGMTSILASHRPGTWWDPWMVVDARASASERAATAQRFASALAAEPTERPASAPALRGIDPELVRRWRAARTTLLAKEAATGEAARIARAAEWMALTESARLLERGRSSDADARISQLENAEGLAPRPVDRWRDGKEIPAMQVPPGDGKLEGELRSRRSLEDRLNVLRSLRTRPIRDLGPLDAETLAREALCAPSEQVRSVAQGVIVDAFDQGPAVLAALLGEMHSASSGAEAAQLAASLANVPAPRGNDAAMRAAAAYLLAEELAGLAPSDRHQLDASTRELALSATSAARVLGGDAVVGMSPEHAMHAWAAARVLDAQRTVPANVLSALLTRAKARLATAVGAPQRFAAEQTLLLEIDGAVLAERLPRKRGDVQTILQRAGAARAQAPDIVAQIDVNARALAELAAMSLGNDGSERAP